MTSSNAYQNLNELESEVHEWLNATLKLPQYFKLFIDDGYDDMEIVMDMTDQDLIDIGIQKTGHRKKILKYIQKRKTNDEEKANDNKQQHHQTSNQNVADLNGKDSNDEKKSDMNQDSNPEKEDEEETKEPGMELQLYGVKCELCNKLHDPENIYICCHIECLNDMKIHCHQCGTFQHQVDTQKHHVFDKLKEYIKSVKSLYDPDETEFDNAKEKAGMVIKVSKVAQFLFHHRWSCGTVATGASIGAVTAASYAVNGASTIASAMGAGGSVIAKGLLAGTLGGAGGALISSGIESIFIWRQYSLDRISCKEAVALTGISLASNAAAAGTFIGGMAIGAACGTPGGPIGVAIGATIGSIIAAVLVGFGVRCGLNYWFEKHFKNEHAMEIKLREEALKFFFNDKNFDTEDEKKFNDTILRKKYHRLAIICHPDRNDGNQDEWLKLSSYYGVLIGVWEKQQGIDAEEGIKSSDDLTEEQRSLVLTAAVKQRASELIGANQTEMVEVSQKNSTQKPKI